MRILLLPVLLALTGCATTAPAPIVVNVAGPKFTASQFDCGTRPIPPDPATGKGKAAARYENTLGAWGQGCSDRLGSVGATLQGAGQVTQP